MNSQICKGLGLLKSKTCNFKQFSSSWMPVRLKREMPVLYYSLKERLKAQDVTLKNPEFYRKVNIGLPLESNVPGPTILERVTVVKEIKQNAVLEKKARTRTLQIDLESFEADSTTTTDRVTQIRDIADHFHIFKHLFGEFAYFYPVVPMSIAYEYDKETLSPVYAGNLLKPSEISKVPDVKFASQSDDLWTLLLINPDGNLYEDDAEVLQWFMGNIPGGKVENGEELVDYLQPFPPRGTGYHRCVFLLYKQSEKIDFSEYNQQSPCLQLQKRTFKNIDFYKKFEDFLTPVGLSFFQADWDSSLTDFFHKTLDMREPTYEYEFPKPYLAPQLHFPAGRQFSHYLDLHRDQKDIQKDMLLKRLSHIHPFKGDLKLLPFPHLVKIDPTLSSWIKDEIRAERDGSGKFMNLYKGDNRPYNHIGQRTLRPPYPIHNRRFIDREEDL